MNIKYLLAQLQVAANYLEPRGNNPARDAVSRAQDAAERLQTLDFDFAELLGVTMKLYVLAGEMLSQLEASGATLETARFTHRLHEVYHDGLCAGCILK